MPANTSPPFAMCTRSISPLCTVHDVFPRGHNFFLDYHVLLTNGTENSRHILLSRFRVILFVYACKVEKRALDATASAPNRIPQPSHLLLID